MLHRSLLPALGFSLLLHVAAILPLPGAKPQTAAPPPAPPLQANLQAPPPKQASKELFLPEPESAAPVPAAREKPVPAAVDRKPARKSWQQQIGEQLARQQRQGLFYPEEAIRQGLQGEALVLLLIDSDGSVIAARIEQGSGHALLDAAALAAVRRLHSLPSDTPGETLLPVRFRLK